MTVILAFIVLGFILYGPGLRGTMLLDDVFIYGKGPMLEGDFRKVLTSPVRVLTRLSYCVNGWLSGGDNYALHVTNVCIHIVNSLITILIFRALGFSETWATVGGFMFLVHPQAVAAGAYISGRSSLVSGFFAMLAILSVLSGWPIFALPLMLAALLSKEDTVATFLLLTFLSYGTWWSLVFLFMPWIIYSQNRKTALKLIELAPHPQKHPHYAVTALTEYLIRLPFWLVGFYLNNKPYIQPPDWKRICAACYILAIIVVSAVYGSPQWNTGLAMVFLAPMLVYMVVRIEDPIMDYRHYVSLVGGVVLMLTLLQPLHVAFGVILAVFLFIRAVPRVLRFRTPITFWVGCMKDGSDKSPYVMTQLAGAFHMMQDLKSAEHWNKKALEAGPATGMAMLNLARIYSQQHRIPECREVLEKCTEVCPTYKKGWESLGQVYAFLKDEMGRLRCEEALAAFKKG